MTDRSKKKHHHHDHPLVSVIMPSYNTDQYIGEAIDSVLAQSYVNWELVICDDSSHDGSRQVIEGYSRQDSRIRAIFHSENQGQSTARNDALAMAQGRFIAFLDSDDLWYPQKLAKQVEFMLANNYTMSYTWYSQITKKGKPVNAVRRPEVYTTYTKLLGVTAVCHSTAMYDRDQIGDLSFPIADTSEDLAFWLQVLRKCGRGYCLQIKLAAYRLTPKSMSSNKIRSALGVWYILTKVERLSLWYASYKFFIYIVYGLTQKSVDILYRH